MSFKLSDIEGAVVVKKPVGILFSGPEILLGQNLVFNQAIDVQSSVPLRFNREKLERIIYDAHVDWSVAKSNGAACKSLIVTVSDAIIAADKEIIEVDQLTTSLDK